jgi:hypothetical protein
MTKFKIGIVAGILALVIETVILTILNVVSAEGFWSRLCFMLHWPATFFGALVGLLGEVLGLRGGIEFILTSLFGFFWFFLIFWVVELQIVKGEK